MNAASITRHVTRGRSSIAGRTGRSTSDGPDQCASVQMLQSHAGPHTHSILQAAWLKKLFGFFFSCFFARCMFLAMPSACSWSCMLDGVKYVRVKMYLFWILFPSILKKQCLYLSPKKQLYFSYLSTCECRTHVLQFQV